MSSIPYAATRDGSIYAHGVDHSAVDVRTTFLVPDFSKPKRSVIGKPRSLKWEEKLPLSNTPPAPAPTGASRHSTVAGQPGPFTGVVSALTDEPNRAAESAPARLTPSQVKTLETAERFGILSEDGANNLRAWRLAISRAELAKKPETFVAKLRRVLSPSFVRGEA